MVSLPPMDIKNERQLLKQVALDWSKNQGDELRRKREAKGIKASYVASVMGVSQPHLSMLEKGNRIWTEPHISAFLKAIGEPLIINNKTKTKGK